MKRRIFAPSRKFPLLFGVLLLLDGPRLLRGEPTAAAVSAFHTYCKAVEMRLAEQHKSASDFVVLPAADPHDAETRLQQGELIVERVTEKTSTAKGGDLSGALLHHWRGTGFAPGAKAADFERLIRDFDAYPRHFSPEVLAGKVLAENGNHMQAWMRVRQRHVITVVMDTTYEIAFGQLDVRHGYSISESERIAEIGSPGTKVERALSGSEEHGFLWRLNTYWSYEERDGGLYLQIEAVSLTRAIPSGLGWVIGPYVESIPRESLEFTLRSACHALQK